jgi:hypothetical protein
MQTHKSQVLAAVLAAVVFSPFAIAQTLTVSPDPILTAGDDAKISYSDPSRGGQTVVVTVTGGFPVQTIEIPIPLDADGSGSKTWKVLSWHSASFNAPGVTELILAVQ